LQQISNNAIVKLFDLYLTELPYYFVKCYEHKVCCFTHNCIVLNSPNGTFLFHKVVCWHLPGDVDVCKLTMLDSLKSV